MYTEAAQHGGVQVAVMALTRLARQFEQTDPAQALEVVRVAGQVGEDRPDTFADRQGARYAPLLAESATALAFNGQPALDDALALLCLAIGNAGRCGAQQELGYALSESCTRENEAGSPLNAQCRVDERIIPRIDEAQRAAASAAVAADPWGVIDAALSPHPLGWRPAP